jgi:peptide deformylase
MKLVNKDDPILTRVCEDFDFNNPSFNPAEFAQELVRYMYDWGGLGLAANQVGVPYRIFAMRGAPQNFVCYNPRIVNASTETVILDESCLSFPGLVVKVKRPVEVRARFTMANGEIVTEVFRGMSARVFQQGMDLLNGELFFNKANRYHREKALTKWRKGDINGININTDVGAFA